MLIVIAILLFLILSISKVARSFGESFRDQRSVEVTLLVVKSHTDHPVPDFHLAGINRIDLLTVVLLAGPSGRTIVVDGVFESVAPTNGQGGLILMGSRDNALPAAQLRLLSLLLSGSLFGFLLAGALGSVCNTAASRRGDSGGSAAPLTHLWPGGSHGRSTIQYHLSD